MCDYNLDPPDDSYEDWIDLDDVIDFSPLIKEVGGENMLFIILPATYEDFVGLDIEKMLDKLTEQFKQFYLGGIELHNNSINPIHKHLFDDALMRFMESTLFDLVG